MERVREWADGSSLESMSRRFERAEMWVAELKGQIVGWVAIRGDYLDALYVDPNHARRGIGAHLLRLVEDVLRRRGVPAIRADASWNSEGFYIRQGYEPLGPRSPDEARPMQKCLLEAKVG